MAKLRQTTDYNQFKILQGNRLLSMTHVKKLAAALKKQNLLDIYPIIVNHDYEVIDGQHRLEAAKIAQVPVYYIVVSGLDLVDTKNINVNQKAWTTGDYINSYAELGYSDYIILRSMLRTYWLPPATTAILVSGEAGADTRLIKEGLFKVGADWDYEKALQTIVDLTKHYGFIKSKAYSRAITRIVRGTEITLEELAKKVINYRKILRQFTSQSDILMEFERCVNYNRKTKHIPLTHLVK